MRILLITSTFPNPLQPTKGTFNLELVRALSLRHEVRVISPISWTDEWQAPRSGRGLPPCRRVCAESAKAVEVHHPRYYFVPKCLRGQYGVFMWYSVQGV